MKRKLIFFLAVLSVLLAGCATAKTDLSSLSPPEEDRIVIYTSHKSNVYQPLIREFEEQTGIWVEVVTGGTYELLELLSDDSAAPRGDIMFGGGVDSMNQYLSLFSFCTYPNPDEIAKPFLQPEGSIAPFSALPVVLIYNTKLVAPGDLTGWEDLKKPEFRGRIAFADPEKSSTSLNTLSVLMQIGGEEALAQLAEALDGNQCGSSASVASSVAEGSCLVGITLESSALQYITAGNNLAMVYPSEGTRCITDGTAILENAPHPENARRFLEFTLSRDVQQFLSTNFYRRSVLKDVVNPGMPPLEEIAIIDYDAKWSSAHTDDLMALWQQLLREGSQ